ncbi:MAG: hypothetical protein HGA87_00140 [Desulfobulbaceae bacterium]|nr:hypothetical protein [Desulfobulbaceae bacterium]
MITTYLYHDAHGKQRFEIDPGELQALYAAGWRETRDKAIDPLQLIADGIDCDCPAESIKKRIVRRRK